ncbi:MAG TPA: pyridoxal-phosphate dependent enzyme [Candidatus Marinimicrobia bacterium]|nr:serine/threonine dehydratase [Candidatus Neomarinimicrobiota bacterium]MDP7122145.1 pyridoxal-phosphate dependent enzyme [Candidatus Neomarinimicrobiota bacterium]MDP7716216.1 pyridoxal-phosphate dependent enzyme [Candidatus Neomarinimicrobiota bacterium]HJL84786.1 pyridoxal-phosphate dependent enzyme [Candidatus Neomarinimicrobiota bacterium]HJM86336.1 pyridoxal-phosphate dependent enzyme [Candidatus Neomarinimicrobiota bacterium]
MTNESQPQLDVPQLVREANERCQDHLLPTPLEHSMYLSDIIEGEVWLKLDSMQRTSSFKFRGAINKILSLTEAELDRGIVSASTGNYALAVAEAMRIRNRRATIYVAKDIEPSRLGLLRSHGLDLVIHGEVAWDAEKEARRVGDEEGKIYVSPYNDPIVVGGQGTCGYEISQQLPDLDAAFLACGGGGLLTGSAGWLKSHNSDVEAFGVSPANSPVMYESMRTNKMVEMDTQPTLADTCAGGIDLDSITLDLCRRYVDEIVLLTEKEIEASIRLLFEQHRLVTEGSGALSIGGLLKRKERFKGKKVVAVVCGRNVNLKVFKKIIA